MPAPLGKVTAEFQPWGSPGWERQFLRGENATLKRINQVVESPVGSAASPLPDLSPGCLMPQFPLLPCWHLGQGPSARLIRAGGWQMAGGEPGKGSCPWGRPGALLSCRSCGHRLVTAGWDKHGGKRGGMGRAKGTGTARSGDVPGRLSAVSPHPGMGWGCIKPLCCSSDPSKVGGMLQSYPAPWRMGT